MITPEIIGYTHCACRDCFEIAIGTDPVLCWECEQAGCDVDGQSDCSVEPELEESDDDQG